MTKKSSQKLILKVASKGALNKNAKALELYCDYKKASDFIDRVDIALGRKASFNINTGSTLNFEINKYGVASTTT